MRQLSLKFITTVLAILLATCLVLFGYKGIVFGSVWVLAGGVFILFPTYRARLYWIKTEGSITKLDHENDGLEFEYLVGKQLYYGTSGQDPSWHRLGQRIRVFYDGNDPTKHWHHNWASELIFGWVFVILGISLMFLIPPG